MAGRKAGLPLVAVGARRRSAGSWRSVRTLINAAPVHGEDRAVVSVVVTFQDLAPLDEVERLRTEFLGLVSHELREPLAAIKGSVATLLEEAQELDPIIRAERPRLVLLDLLLPGHDGIALMQEVRERFDLPVIFISTYGRDETVAQALESGAADYLVKPFSPTELVARVRAALGRHERPEPFTLGDLAIDYARRRVTVGGEAVALTATEYDLLRVLSLDAGRVVSYDTLLERVWAGREGASANCVRIFVRNLRAKLGDDAARPGYIFSERGVGYRMPDPGEE